jgi:molecular chaperone IbpA
MLGTGTAQPIGVHMTRLHFPNVFMDTDLWSGMLQDLSRTKFPPTDIVRIDTNEYKINMAIAGYRNDDIRVSQDKRVLTVEGYGSEKKEDANYVMNGITKGKFLRHFPLADHIVVGKVELTDGMLVIGLSREVPDKDKPKEFDIN